MRNLTFNLGLSLILLSLASDLASGAESVSFQTTIEGQNLSGNNQPSCSDPIFVSGTFEFDGQSLSDGFLGCCGLFSGHITADLTNLIAGEGAYSGSYQTLGAAVLCCSPTVLCSGKPSCFDQEVVYNWPTGAACDEGHRPSYFEWTVFFRRNTASSPVAQWQLVNASHSPVSSAPVNGHYQLPADGMSTATATVINTTETPTFVFTGDSLGCTLTSAGLLTAGTNIGTVQVTEQLTNTDICLQRDFFFDLGPACQACIDNCTKPDSQVNSVDIRVDLGPSRKGSVNPFLQVLAGVPTPDLGIPKLLHCDFQRMDLEKITNSAGWVRQVRALERTVDVVTNSVSSYSLNLYYPTNVMPKVSGLYQFIGAPFRTVTVELVGGDTNHVRMTDSLDPATADYYWQTNGWELVRGNGLRHETKLISVAGAIRTEDRTIKNNAGVLERESIEQWQTNVFGDRLISEVFGAGADSRTNSYSYDSNGQLYQVVRGDGSWDIYVIDSMGRQIQHFSPFLNSAVTSNSSLCRLTASTYTNSVVSGSGDDYHLEPLTPRLVTESILGVEVSRRYNVVKTGERRDIRCPNPGAAWNDANNLVTITRFRTDSLYFGRPSQIFNADGTVQLYSYAQNQSVPGGSSQPIFDKLTILTGAPNASTNDIVRGTRVETWTDLAHRTVLSIVTDIPSFLVISSERNFYDSQGHLISTIFLDGTSVSQVYDCCQLQSRTERDGMVTSFGYDALGRQTTTTRDGITVSNVFNSAGDVVATVRFGTNGSSITLSLSGYDTAGRLLAATNALNEITSYSEVVDGSGQTIRTTTFPDTSTRIETTARDHTLLQVGGTSTLGVRYDMNTASIDGINRLYSKEIRLLTNGSDSAEWARSVNDGLGRTIQTEFPDNSTNRSVFNALGQLFKEVDPDGVTTLTTYDNIGQTEYRAIDINRNDVIDLAGTDRVTRTVTDVVSNSMYGTTVRRALTYGWAANNDATSTLLSENSQSADGHQTWSFASGLTNYSRLDYLGGGRNRVTLGAPDGTQTIQDSQSGRQLSITISNASLGVLQQQTVGYDAHNRRSQETDLRNGTTSYTFDDLDRVLTVTTPQASPSEAAQVTTTVYDSASRVVRTQAPDGLWITNEYFLNGLYRKTTGARVYPVQYTFDYSGRPATMTTWQDYAGQANAAVTTWLYDGLRGFLTNKVYADGKGPAYTYTKAGRLVTRNWARGLLTSYSFNNAGEVQLVDYADATPDVNYSYDRQGRPLQVTAATTNDFVFTAAGLMLSENAVNKAWNYASQNRFGYDTLERRTALTNLSLGITHNFGFGAASRLQTVSTLDSGLSTVITYSYLSNSPLVGGLTFQQGATTRMTTTKQFDFLNRLTQVTSQPSGTSAVSSAYAYNPANQRTSATNADGSYWRFGYDFLGQVTNGWRFWSDASEVLGQTFNYAFDDIGNRKTVSSGASSALRTQSYSANTLNQYTNRTVPGFIEVNGSADVSASVTVNGGATSRHSEYFRQEVGVANSSTAVIQWLTNRAVIATGTSVVTRANYLPQTPEVSTYDADGNLTQNGLWNYTWDAENRLIRMETRTNAITDTSYWQRLDFTYDYMSRRVRKQVSAWTGTGWAPIGAKRFFFDGWKLIGQLDEVKGIRLSFVWGRDLSGSAQGAGGVGGLVALIVHNGSVAGTYFYGYDGNGDVAVLINAADGTEAARYEYAPFGELLRLSGPIANVNPIRFSTKYQDDETGLIYYGHRYLSNLTGRWLSRDPSEEAAGGHNLYALLANDAVDKVDFLGLWDEEGHNFFLDYWLVNRKTPPDKTYNLYKWRCFYLPVFSLLKEGNDIVDGTGYPGHGFWQAQSTANAYQHAMRVPRQPVWEAQSLYLQFLRNSITEAQLHVRNARFLFDSDRERAKTEMEQAIIAIGKGQHALADSTSPVHRGFQVWFGPDTFGLSAAEALPQVVESGLPGWIGLGFAADAYALYLQWHHSHETINIARQYKGETRAKIENVFGSTLDEILRE